MPSISCLYLTELIGAEIQHSNRGRCHDAYHQYVLRRYGLWVLETGVSFHLAWHYAYNGSTRHTMEYTMVSFLFALCNISICLKSKLSFINDISREKSLICPEGHCHHKTNTIQSREGSVGATGVQLVRTLQTVAARLVYIKKKKLLSF